MPESKSNPIDRREFLQAGVVGTAAVSSISPGIVSAADESKPTPNKPVLPTRVLGKTGAKVTILNQGTVGEPASLSRLLRYAYKQGVRYFDTAGEYANAETVFRDWFIAEPEVRKNIFLATKNNVIKTPDEMLTKVGQRLARLGTDHIDLLFFHSLSTSQVDWPKSKEMKETVEALKKTGKVKHVGFSTHDATIAQQLKNAAEGGFIDVIMLRFSPWLDKKSALNKAIDACHKANIGLVSMKQIGGQALKITEERVPSLRAKKLTPAQGLLHAIWTDERFSSACVTMRTSDQTNENSDAARRFEPLNLAEMTELHEALVAAGPTMCPNCDGRCSVAAGTKAKLGDLTRFYTYYDDHGIRSHARDRYSELAANERDWQGADLAAAREACHNKIDFAKILPEVDRLLA